MNISLPYHRLWAVHFDTPHALASFPRLLTVAEDVTSTTDYRSEGRYRRAEDHCIFQYTLSGAGYVWHGSRRWAVPHGHGFLAIIDDVETGFAYPDGASASWDVLWIGFTGGNVRSMVRELLSRYGPLYAFPVDHKLIRQFRLFEQPTEYRTTMDPVVGGRIVFDLLTELGKFAVQPSRHTVHEPLMESILDFIDISHGSQLSIGIIAQQLAISREHLSRTFHARWGMSLQQFILQKKILLSCHLLKETHLSIKEIAHRLGYETPSNFTRAFRRVMQMNPQDFREYGTIPLL